MASPDQMRELTVQVKNNTEDLQAYLRDLEVWQNEMEQKDNQLRAKVNDAKDSKPCDDKQPTKRKVVERIDAPNFKTTKQPKEQKIRAYDYDKWDKFDVDKALEDIDERGETCSENDLEEDDDETEAAQLIQQAIVEKDRGNEYFKNGQFDNAINCYTKGIACDPTNAVLPANRAMALLKKGLFAAAEADCSVAIDLDPTYVKALLRRATARCKLNKMQEAIHDYERILQQEPDDTEAKAALKKLRLQQSLEKAPDEAVRKVDSSFNDNIQASFSKRTTPASSGLQPGQVLPVVKLPHLRSKKPLKRIEITEMGDDAHMTEVRDISAVRIEAPKISKSSELQLKVEKEISESLAQTRLDAKGVITALPTKPKNSVQFLSAWTGLPENLKLPYLNQISVTDYPNVFKHSLEPKVLSEILRTLSHSVDSKYTMSHLLGLSRVPRISAIVMFMKEDEAALVAHLITKIIGVASKEELFVIQKCFQV